MSRILLCLLAAIVLVAPVTRADTPDPTRCVTTLDAVQRVYMAPDGLGDLLAASFTVTVRNAANNPIANAVVEVLIGGQDTGHTRICPSQTLTATTNPSGVVSFNVGGGGCMKGTGAAIIRAEGVDIRSFGVVVSADYASCDNQGFPDMSDLAVNAQDLAAFVACLQDGGPSCHDYNNNGGTSLEDLATFTSAYKGGTNRCP